MAEYLPKAAALAQSAAELSRKVSENILENARDLRLDTQTIQLYESSSTDLQGLENLLDSNYDRDKLLALKRLIAMISKGMNVSEYFAGVVKNVASNSLEVRKLVYIYLLRYAEQEPDLALLSINTFQKDLSDPSPIIRAMALRVMSGIRIRMITPIILLALRKAATDLSPYVRKSAAFALLKCHSLNSDQKDLVDLIKVYLNDQSHISLGGVIMAFNQLCPERYDLIHPHYRKLCRLLPEFDEWSQTATLHLLLRYVRTQFADPNSLPATGKSNFSKEAEQNEFYSGISSKISMDPDHSLLLHSVKPLLLSQNSGVVLSTASLIFHASPDSSCIGKPLVRLLRSHREVQFIVLTNISVMAHLSPSIFSPFLSHFFVRSGDPKIIRDLKLEIITIIVTPSTLGILLKELQSYTQSPDEDLVGAAVRAIGRCSTCTPQAGATCLHSLLNLISDQNSVVVGEAIIVIKQLLQTTASEQNITPYLKHLLYTFHNNSELLPEARAAILWLMGQYSNLIEDYVTDVLRVATRDFKGSDETVKAQCLTLGIKLVSRWPNNEMMSKLFSHMLSVARYDVSFDLRDRARFLQGAFQLSSVSQEEANQIPDGQSNETPVRVIGSNLTAIFNEDKPAPLYLSAAHDRSRFTIGSASLQLNHQVRGYQPLPDWPATPPDGSERDVANINEPKPTYSNNAPKENPYKPKKSSNENNMDLDAFYGDASSESETDDDDEDESSSEHPSEESSQISSDFTESEDEVSDSSNETDTDVPIPERQTLTKAEYHQI